VVVEVTRGGVVESRHRASIAVVASDGELIAGLGDPDQVLFLRSSAKPFQLAPFVASGRFDGYGFGNADEGLAIMAASHSGEDRHVRTVQALLRQGGLSREILQCGTHPPFDSETAARLIRDAEPLTPLRHNCSGKHAGMALHARAAGWEVETYWHPEHPVQRLALETVAAVTDLPPDQIETATDGCGVVTFALPLRNAALAFARLADPAPLTDDALRGALPRIRDAMMEHPELVAGERHRLDTALMRAAPGAVVSKGGAEGLSSVGALGGEKRGMDGRALGIAVRIEDGDGARRAGGVAVCATLRQLGIHDETAIERLREFAAPPILDPRGEPSGEVRATLTLQ
jgi:L-asparaginase II